MAAAHDHGAASGSHTPLRPMDAQARASRGAGDQSRRGEYAGGGEHGGV